MPIEIYKVIHVVGISLLFFGFGAVVIQNLLSTNTKGLPRMIGFITHGLGLLLLIVSGFGMTAKLGIMMELPLWVKIKVALWVWAGLLITLAKRRAKWGWLTVAILISVAAIAGSVAIFKPI